MICPGCDGYTSSILMAVRDGQPCPYCGLSASAITEIDALQQNRADEELKARLEAAIKDRDAAQAKAARLERQLARITSAVRQVDLENDRG